MKIEKQIILYNGSGCNIGMFESVREFAEWLLNRMDIEDGLQDGDVIRVVESEEN